MFRRDGDFFLLGTAMAVSLLQHSMCGAPPVAVRVKKRAAE
jgi:hypothetical protein